MSVAPLFKSGQWAGVPADQVPEKTLTYMLENITDLHPSVRTKITAELARRDQAGASPSSPPPGPSSRPSPSPSSPDDVELLPEDLQGGEAVEFTINCAHCGRRNVLRGQVDTK